MDLHEHVWLRFNISLAFVCFIQTNKDGHLRVYSILSIQYTSVVTLCNFNHFSTITFYYHVFKIICMCVFFFKLSFKCIRTKQLNGCSRHKARKNTGPTNSPTKRGVKEY